MMKRGGMIAFISSNKWLRAGYGAPLRKEVDQQCSIFSVTDFGELPVFETAATFPMIFIAEKGGQDRDLKFTQVPDLETPYPDIGAIISASGHTLKRTSIAGETWTLASAGQFALKEKMQTGSKPLIEYVGEHIYRGVVSGLTEAFTITATQRAAFIKASPACKKAIKPLLRGDDIRKWRADSHGKWLLYLPHGVNTDGLEPLLAHLKPFKKQLENRATTQEWYELQQPQERYAEKFARPKIVFPDIAKESRFTLDRTGAYISNTAYAIGTEDLFLLAVLNSKAIWEYVRTNFACLGDPNAGGRFRFFFQAHQKSRR
jgi:hypothetical protein